MDPLLISILKYGFLALLFLFVFWAIRTVAVTMRVPKGERRRSGRSGSRRGSTVPHVVIVRVDGKRAGSHKLDGPMQVGRADACEIRPRDDYLSQFHARLYPRDGIWFVEDLGSTNGTYLNEHKLAGPLEVHAGDDVRLGRTVLQLRR